ncbi:hypothetical protein ACD661_11365 [Legionella lytica]|uniref:Uncharacterized protein n=1 Tax=Legionella lytica TaxID=96232 RepID=A0ABW8D8X7_9GAMM
MKKDLQERFHLLRGSTPFHESGNNIDIKFCDNELTINYSRLTYAPSIDGLLIQHTSPSEFINSKKIMSILYDKLIQDENYYQNKDNFLKFIKTLAELSWHLSQAMLFSRGSASINELLITSILSYKKIHLPEYKEIGTCDLMAIFRYPRRVLSGVS